MTRPSTDGSSFYFGDSIGMSTCLEVQNGIDNSIYSSSQCDDIMKVTRDVVDRCLCVDITTGDACGTSATTTVSPRGCDICGSVGQDYVASDSNQVIDDVSSLWYGLLCGELVSLQSTFDFCEDQCVAAQSAAEEFCQCQPVTASAAEACIPQEDTSNPCDPDDDSKSCCVGSCQYLSSMQAFVCTTRDGYPAPQPISQAAPAPNPDSPTGQNPTPTPTLSPTETIVPETPNPTMQETLGPSILETDSPSQVNTPRPTSRHRPKASPTQAPGALRTERPVATSPSATQASLLDNSGSVPIGAPIAYLCLGLFEVIYLLM
ncbi:hypothetical protein MHU86_1847 [Fragilaria crotonensis]|nr:hypothetical protein MHU86_1847 [Fragilaria crotonensis]